MKRILTALSVVAFFFTLPGSVSAFSGSEVHITNDGVASVSSARVMQIIGNTFFTRLYWGNSYVRLTVKTGDTTKFFRGTGEQTTIQEIKEGDLLDISGELESGSDT